MKLKFDFSPFYTVLIMILATLQFTGVVNFGYWWILFLAPVAFAFGFILVTWIIFLVAWKTGNLKITRK